MFFSWSWTSQYRPRVTRSTRYRSSSTTTSSPRRSSGLAWSGLHLPRLGALPQLLCQGGGRGGEQAEERLDVGPRDRHGRGGHRLDPDRVARPAALEVSPVREREGDHLIEPDAGRLAQHVRRRQPRGVPLQAGPVVQPEHAVAGEQVPVVIAVVEQVVGVHLHRHRLRRPAEPGLARSGVSWCRASPIRWTSSTAAVSGSMTPARLASSAGAGLPCAAAAGGSRTDPHRAQDELAGQEPAADPSTPPAIARRTVPAASGACVPGTVRWTGSFSSSAVAAWLRIASWHRYSSGRVPGPAAP